jgi:hypothetical protein
VAVKAARRFPFLEIATIAPFASISPKRNPFRSRSLSKSISARSKEIFLRFVRFSLTACPTLTAPERRLLADDDLRVCPARIVVRPSRLHRAGETPAPQFIFGQPLTPPSIIGRGISEADSGCALKFILQHSYLIIFQGAYHDTP